MSRELFVKYLKTEPKKPEPVKSLFFDQNKNSIFHQRESIRLSRIEAEALSIAVLHLQKASAELHAAAAALYQYEGIDKAHLSLAHSFVDTYIWQFLEYSAQSVGTLKPNYERLKQARGG